jgi:hypothetical protein
MARTRQAIPEMGILTRTCLRLGDQIFQPLQILLLMSIWAITAYFNPRKFQARLRNYRTFRCQLCIPLLTVEWSQDGDFQLGANEADQMVRVRGGDLMWQKERLLAIAATHLPQECDGILLIDADILLPEGWVDQLPLALERAPVVQPFREVHHLPPLPQEVLQTPELLLQQRHLFYLSRQSFADHALHGALPTAHPNVKLDSSSGQQQEVERLAARPSFGHAWALRREWLERVGLYEHSVAGSGDLAFAMAIAGLAGEYCASYPLNQAQQCHYLRWAAAAVLPRGEGPARIGRLDGVALHLFHGHLNRRSYRSRLKVLSASGFDPALDLSAEAGQPFRWSHSRDRTEALPRFFETYFHNRAEDEGLTPLLEQHRA